MRQQSVLNLLSRDSVLQDEILVRYRLSILERDARTTQSLSLNFDLMRRSLDLINRHARIQTYFERDVVTGARARSRDLRRDARSVRHLRRVRRKASAL